MADPVFDGLITFFASHHAVRAEKVLTDAGFAAKLVPGPKELSPNCGVALRFRYEQRNEAIDILAIKNVTIDEVLQYRPATDAFGESHTSAKSGFLRRRRGP